MFGFNDKPKHTIQELLTTGALVVDVRSPEEFATGHYTNSVNIPLDTLSSVLPSLASKSTPIVVVCLSGGRSAAAVQILKRAGINAINGGAWASLK